MAEGKEKGWISVYRKIQDGWLWEDRPFSRGQAWIDLILLANHQEKRIVLGNELIDVERGTFVSSIRKLCDRWGWSNNKVKKFLELLEIDKKIIKKSDTKKTTITIVNYSVYQDMSDTKSDAKATGKRRTSDRQATRSHTNNNVNNDNNYNNVINTIGAFTSNKDLFNTILKFVEMRKNIKKEMTDDALEIMLKKLNKLSNDENIQIEILNESIMNCWQGIFPLKEEKKDKPTTYSKKPSTFNNFEQRDYDSKLEEKLLNRGTNDIKEEQSVDSKSILENIKNKAKAHIA